MDLATIEMPKDEALQAFREYRDAVRERHDDELEEIMRGYRALSQGRQLVTLSEAMGRAGVDDEGMPRLAIARADEKWCRVEMDTDGSATFIGFKTPGWSGDERHRAPSRRVALLRASFPPFVWDTRPPYSTRAAVVPIVPAGLRPKHALRNYHVLWEAEWQHRTPVDPALLKRISGDLFAVVAVWDLTELERAVLGGRLIEA